MRHVTRWLRRYWPDGNPLRRRADRLESAGLVVAVLLSLVSVWPAVAAGQHTYEAALDAGDGGRVRVQATLLADVPATNLTFGAVIADELTSARWTTPGGEQRVGEVHAPSLARAGTQVPIWIDAAGQPALQPPSPEELQITAVLTGMLIWAVWAALVAAAFAGFRWLLDRGRYRAWEAAWAARADERRRHRP